MSFAPPRIGFDFRRALPRRTLLRGTGVALAVPWLSAMQAAFGDTASPNPPRRFVAMTLGLGLVADNLNPATAGRDWVPSRYLESVADLRSRFTVVSGASHPNVSGGHRAEASLLTAAPMTASAQSRNTVSLDQLLAKHLGGQTRFPSLVLGLGGSSPSYTEQGSMIPAEDSPARLFTRLFVADSPTERARQAERARQGRSIMDLVADDTRALERELGAGDRVRLDAYFTSVRELEKRLVASESWVNAPKPAVDITKPVDIGNPNDFVGRQRLMSDMVRLALVTDSTRFITLHLGGSGGVVPIAGVAEGYHSLSHHGRDEEKLAQLALVETEIVRAWGDFLRGLIAAEEGEGCVLDRATVLLTSNLGNASSHDNRNMPVLVAGGGFAHGSHLAFDRQKNHPLPNLFVSVLRQTGLRADSFATSTGTMPGLEPTV
ncbi:MAG: DUF1552 domain-containing protein [Planctomycetia bacterium]|nr:DUF1552 domain-containing protein [Planctomycetia bacterium]